ncbi:ABC transporter permease [Desulfotruncus alcoholivorax]|uniref:ABC transporter permease n=1 Tax=Desulfotruncus alcoholivorax TaxID=265477 RepID=UPI0003F5BD38|nr:ABC transporter permease [Desulfotruncus alcoholivorax]
MIQPFLPDVSELVCQVFKRNFTVFRRTWMVSMSFNFVEPLLYLAAMGVGLGSYVRPMEGLPYLNFIAPGLTVTSAMFAAAYECTYGSFIRMEFQKIYNAIIATPASADDVVLGDMLWGGFKSLLYGTVILLVILALGLVRSPWALLTPPVFLLAGITFAAMSMVWVGLVPSIDSFNYFFSLVVTPLFLLSGVFFPVDDLAPAMRAAAWLSPLYHSVRVARGMINGSVGTYILADILWLAVLALLLVPLALYLMRRLLIK